MSGFNFGSGTGSAGGFSFSAPPPTTATTASSTTGISFLPPTSSTASTSSTAFKLTGFPAPTTSSAEFSFGSNSIAPTTTTASLAASSSSGTPLFNVNTSAAPSSPGFNIGLNIPKTSTSLAPMGITAPLGGSSSTTTTGPASFSFTPSTVTNPTVSSAAAVVSSFGPVATLSTATSTSSFGTMGGGGATNLTMRQLEERLNKWLVELKEQEERFLRQAAHVNAWDQVLQSGHEQVQQLKDTLHTVKSDQSRLEAEIDFIRGQQEELERLLEPLESATNVNPSAQLHQGDRQRDNMYYLAQNLDAQLRQMTDDLGKVIEHLNTNSGSLQPNDPVSLVARILSAHMDTLKWVDQNTTLLSQKVDDVTRFSASVGKRS